MSNQVYSNLQHKYFAQPGQSVWNLAADQTVAKVGGAVPIELVTPLYDQGSAAFLVINPSFNFVCQVEGVYYLNLIVGSEMTAPSTSNWEYEIGILLLAGNGAATNQIVTRWKGAVNRQAAPDDETRVIQSCCCMVYLPQGAEFRCYAINSIAAEQLAMQDDLTQLLVTKLA